MALRTFILVVASIMKVYSLLFVVGYLGFSAATMKKAEPVNFALYYESMCGGCEYFITHQYYPAFTSIGSIMNVHLVPYGNAEEKKKGGKWVFNCQHGKEECIGNLIETCAIHLYPNASVYFPFIHCIEASFGSIPRKLAPSCAKKFQLDYSKIEACANGDLGNSLEHEMALKTEALNPPNEYVPWVTLEGVHTEKIQNEAEHDLIGLICKTYKGNPKPPACQKHSNVKSLQRCLKSRGEVEEIEDNSIDY